MTTVKVWIKKPGQKDDDAVSVDIPADSIVQTLKEAYLGTKEPSRIAVLVLKCGGTELSNRRTYQSYLDELPTLANATLVAEDGDKTEKALVLDLDVQPSGCITLASGYSLVLVLALGTGADSVVYQAYDLQLSKFVVVKIAPMSSCLSQIATEILALSELASCRGVPKLIHTSTFQENFKVLVTDKPGVSLARIALNGNLPITFLLKIAACILRTFVHIHNHGVIHRDVKPDNIVMWRGRIILIDFGLAAVRGKRLQSASGTMSFCSIAAMQTSVPLPWDDLESLGYTLISLANGKLPWDGLSWSQVVKQKKQSARKICVGLPAIFADFLNYSRTSRAVSSVPDYLLWIRKFRKAVDGINLVYC